MVGGLECRLAWPTGLTAELLPDFALEGRATYGRQAADDEMSNKVGGGLVISPPNPMYML